MGIDYNAVMAAASVVAAIAAIIAIWIESRRSRFATGVDLIHKLDREFRGEHFIKTRQNASLELSQAPIKTTHAIDEILNFFEEIAFFARRGAPDLYTTWYFFFSYMYRFHTIAAAYIQEQRRKDSTLWANYLKLYPKLLAIEHAERSKLGTKKDLDKDDIELFLLEERTIATDVKQETV